MWRNNSVGGWRCAVKTAVRNQRCYSQEGRWRKYKRERLLELARQRERIVNELTEIGGIDGD